MSPTLIPLQQLVVCESNVRSRPYTPESVASLAASIERKGLLQSPLGYRKSKKRVALYGGGRRLKALQLLDQEGRLPESLQAGIPVNLRDGSLADRVAASFDENVERVDLSPVEQFHAFQRLREQGLDDDAIAIEMNVTARIVRQRLSLSALHPRILEAFEEGKFGIEFLQAFTSTDNTERQLEVLDEMLNAYYKWSVHQLRHQLLHDAITPSHRLVKFVGRENYEAAGGSFTEDLFDENQCFCDNPALLTELATGKLEEHAAAIADEGWKWVTPVTTLVYSEIREYGRHYPENRFRDEAAENRDAEISARLEVLESLYQSETDDDALAKLGEEFDSLESERETLTIEAFTDDQIAQSGVFVSVSQTGELLVERGLIRPEDQSAAPEAPSPSSEENAQTSQNADQDKAYRLSNRLAEDIDRALQAGIQHAIMEDQKTAFLLSTAHLAKITFRHSRRSITISSDGPANNASAIEVITSQKASEQFDAWSERLKNAECLLEELASWPEDDVHALHTFCAAHLYTRSTDWGRNNNPDSHQTLRGLLGFKPENHFSADAAFFGHFTKGQIATACQIMDSTMTPASNAKKSDMVPVATKLAAKSGWLPSAFTDERGYGLVAPTPALEDA
ncbi:ParB/RepB/Spo0J family partition protein [Glycocaulis sp.]|uniref:ParB/RepB/Spo0J family partition protein n=1 Tax=Glycocaulis sp. TaxID=1969725 RepID=UPI0025B88755|nr:ParB/RepB/Spo0J family partition protein [Glycocaulis sp.]MCH8522383.1 ParB/RepB/Spo0J family partition protein [Glycocaulis sp.]